MSDAISRWNRFVLDPKDEHEVTIYDEYAGPSSLISTIPKSDSRKSSAEPFNLVSAIHAAENLEGSAHAFEVNADAWLTTSFDKALGYLRAIFIQ